MEDVQMEDGAMQDVFNCDIWGINLLEDIGHDENFDTEALWEQLAQEPGMIEDLEHGNINSTIFGLLEAEAYNFDGAIISEDPLDPRLSAKKQPLTIAKGSRPKRPTTANAKKVRSAEQEENIAITIRTLTPRLGFSIRYARDKRLEGSVVAIENASIVEFPLGIRAQYPIEQDLYWSTLSAAARQACHDYAKLKMIETNKDTPYIKDKNGATGGPQDWKYTGSDGRERLITDMLTVRVRKGLDPITRIASTQEELEAILPPINENFIRPEGMECRSATLETVEHLVRLVPERGNDIVDFLHTEEGKKYVQSTTIVKPSEKSAEWRKMTEEERRQKQAAREEKKRATKEGKRLKRSGRVGKRERIVEHIVVDAGRRVGEKRVKETPEPFAAGSVQPKIVAVNEFTWSGKNSLAEFARHPALLHLCAVEEKFLGERNCVGCGKDFQCKAQNEAMVNGTKLGEPLCSGFVCPNHPETHAFCFDCLLRDCLTKADALEFPFYCPGYYVRVKRVYGDAEETIEENLRCDYAYYSDYLHYVVRNYQFSDNRGASEARTLKQCYIKRMQDAAVHAQIEKCVKINPYHHFTRCPHALGEAQCMYPTLWDRREVAVPVIAQCTYDRCQGLYCTGCNSPVDSEHRKEHEVECKTWFHTTYDAIIETPDVLAKALSAKSKAKDRLLNDRIVECIVRCHRMATTVPCPSCKTSVNLIEYHRTHHQGERMKTQITHCRCNVDWCYLCERVLPRTPMQEKIVRKYSMHWSIAPYSTQSEEQCDPCRHNDHGLEALRKECEGSTEKRAFCPLYVDSIREVIQHWPEDEEGIVNELYDHKALTMLGSLLRALGQSERREAVFSALPDDAIRERVLRWFNNTQY